MQAALLKLPDDHVAKLGYETYPCGGELVRSLAFVNVPKSLRAMIELCFKRVDPRLPFLIFENEQHSYGGIWRRVCALAAALRRDFGVSVGDRVRLDTLRFVIGRDRTLSCSLTHRPLAPTQVSISMRNYPEWCIAFLAAACAGAIVVPLNSWWSKFRAQREITLTARGVKLTRLCSHAPVAALLPARVGQSTRRWLMG